MIFCQKNIYSICNFFKKTDLERFKMWCDSMISECFAQLFQTVEGGSAALGLLQMTGLWVATFGVFVVLCRQLLGFFQRFCASGQREYLPSTHQAKGKTPTMGGVLIIVSILTSIVLFLRAITPSVAALISIMLLYGAIGLYDDLCKIWYRKGISARFKSSCQLVGAGIVSILWMLTAEPSFEIWVPFVGFLSVGAIVFLIWSMFVIIGCSNAVNLTDGLDGLAASSLMIVFLGMGIISKFTAPESLLLPFCVIASGACAGFLLFNKYPARIFMGDVGSLSMGGLLGLIALMTKFEFFLVLVGGVFVAEVLSVLMQVLSMRLLGRRIFKMSPVHHHFELSGWHEVAITRLFTLVTLALTVLGLWYFYVAVRPIYSAPSPAIHHARS